MRKKYGSTPAQRRALVRIVNEKLLGATAKMIAEMLNDTRTKSTAKDGKWTARAVQRLLEREDVCELYEQEADKRAAEADEAQSKLEPLEINWDEPHMYYNAETEEWEEEVIPAPEVHRKQFDPEKYKKQLAEREARMEEIRRSRESRPKSMSPMGKALLKEVNKR